jgi:inner membrane protein
VPSVLAHALVGAAAAPLLPRGVPRPLAAAALAGLSVLPDLDVVAFSLGIPYAHPFGHRGFSHSLLFAGLVGAAAALALRARGGPARWRVGIVCALVTASHGVLDAFTDGGLGVAFLFPSGERWFAPWRPIAVAPLSLAGFASGWGAAVLASEALWIGAPLAALAAARLWLRARARPGP